MRRNNMHGMFLSEFHAQTADEILDAAAARRIVPRDYKDLHATVYRCFRPQR